MLAAIAEGLFLMIARVLLCAVMSSWLLGSMSSRIKADEYGKTVRPVLLQNCIRCHGGEDTNGDVDLKQIETAEQLLKQPELIEAVYDAIEGDNMPPESEPQLSAADRTQVLTELKQLLRIAASRTKPATQHLRRLNRFQYNNSVRDLFQLNRDIFGLSEKLMTRHTSYIGADIQRVPDVVNVSSESLKPQPGLRDVKAFPKDLRASHGFDNQANQLSLSPLLLDAFLRLSVSIVESPDFNRETVGVWNQFFERPEGLADPADDATLRGEVRSRLSRFLPLAFRNPVEAAVLDRYTDYAVGKIRSGLTFTDGMKKVASAALSSPMFLLRTETPDTTDDAYELASRLSYLLWASGPDAELMELARTGQLSDRRILRQTVERMMADRRIERFLDAFPTQWMQLENVLAATPDPAKSRYFNLDKERPASLQMLVEPLLLFDAVFVENRPVRELIQPTFSYQSDFLRDWYTTRMRPPEVDVARLEARNRTNESRRQELAKQLNTTQQKLMLLEQPVRERLVEQKRKQNSETKSIDLRPIAAWDFDGNLKDQIGELDLTSNGEVKFENGMVHLKRSYLLSKKLPMDLKAKSLEVWLQLSNLDQNGGGAMGIQGPGDFFDTIVIGERKPRHWISGSNGFSRTEDFPDSTPEDVTDALIHLVMVYEEDGTTRLYRNGQPYGKSFRKGAATFPTGKTSVIFGLRHLPAGGNRFLETSIDKARLYDRALNAEEVAASSAGNLFISTDELVEALQPAQRAEREQFLQSAERLRKELSEVPPTEEIAKVRNAVRTRFENQVRNKLRARTFRRQELSDPRYGGIITSAAMLTMTSGPKRTHPIARGAWIIEVILNDPPPPPPNDVPPLNEDSGDQNLTIREKFAKHREHIDCAGCHARLDPLGFAMENFDITGRWRDRYENGREVDSAGTLMKKHPFSNVVEFKKSLVTEDERFARAFAEHLLRFAVSRELTAADRFSIDDIVSHSSEDGFRMKSVLRNVILSPSFLKQPVPLTSKTGVETD